MSDFSDPELINNLNAGMVGVLPTDTVYGLVCRADDQTAVARLYKLKDREQKPGTVIAADSAQLENLGLKREQLAKVKTYWPNPISVIIPVTGLGYLTQGKDSLAVRVPADDALHLLLLLTGPLLTSSANQPGEPPAATIQEARQYFGDLVDFYIDGGVRPSENSSTIIRITGEGAEVIRQGNTKIDEQGRIA